MLRVESDGGIATITLDRPERLNAWTTELELAYDATLRDLAVDAEVRAAIVTGAGRGYSAGWDMGELREVGDAGSVPTTARSASRSPRPSPSQSR